MQQFDNNDIQGLKNIVRIGMVSSVNPDKMTARVKIQEQGIVTGNLKIAQNTPTVKIEQTGGTCDAGCKVAVETWMPKVGQWVLCVFMPDGEGDGFILGGI